MDADIMKQVVGIWLPKDDHHLEPILKMGPVVRGRTTYQYHKYQKALKFVRRQRLAVDVGGHVGLWSRVMSYDFYRVVTFEPVALHRQCFEKNCVECLNVELRPFAVGASTNKVEINTPYDNTGHSQVLEVADATIPMVTLDTQEFGDHIDFLKIDVEGYELNVVRGGEETIRRDRPVIIIEQKPNGNAENFGFKQHDAVNLLKKWGMKEMAVMSGDHIMVW